MNKEKMEMVKQEVEEEEEIKQLFVGIMEGYNDSAIPPLSYFSPSQDEICHNIKKGSSTRKRERGKDRITENYSVLQSMVPPLFNKPKPKLQRSHEKLINDTIKYIKCLEDEIQRLEGLKKQQCQEQDVVKPAFSKCTSHNLSTQFRVSDGATFLAVQLPFRRALVLEIVKVLEKNQAEVLEARVCVNDQRLLMFTATVLFANDGAAKIDKLREEISLL